MISKLRGSDGIFVRSSNIDICVRVCIDIRFRFVAVWSEIESQNCNYNELNKCHDFLQVLKESRTFQFLETRQWMDLVCT